MVELKDVSFSYRRAALFRGLDMTLAPGTIYGLLGVNGAGKSTLLKLLSGLLFADAGAIRVLDRDPGRRDPGFLAQVFVLPEELNVPSVADHEYIRSRAPFYPRFDHDRFARYRTELEIPQGAKLNTLSHGQQKKFLLAFGLACNSALLLLDEPTNGLDIPSKAQFRRLVAEALTADRVFVISTHQVRDVGALIDPIVVLHGGSVILNRTLAEIGSHLRMSRSTSPPDPRAPGLLYTEPAVGGYWAVWAGSDPGDSGSLDLEVLFNALIAQPHACAQAFANGGGRA
jgi:ABC-2 type transport system ATP-binding protein